MSIMTIDPGTLEVTQILESLDFAPACEESDHDTNKVHHDDGPAKWWATLVNPCCGKTTQAMICDRAKRTALEALEMLSLLTPVMACRGCGVNIPVRDLKVDFKPL